MVNNEYLESLNQVINRQHQTVVQFCNHIDKPVNQLKCATKKLIRNSYRHHNYSIPEQLYILEFIQNNR